MRRVVVVGSSNTNLTVLRPTLTGRGEIVLDGELHTTARGKNANQAVADRIDERQWFSARIKF